MKTKEKIFGLDLIRNIATIMVIGVHFFLNTKYYENPIEGTSMIVQVFIRNLFYVCVPLFIILTGYLNNHTKYDKKFFKSLGKILLIWFIYSNLEYFIMRFHDPSLSITIKDYITSLTTFTASKYSWYIEMYIGLYLLSPVINTAFDSFDDKNKLYVLLTFIIVFLIPETINNIIKNDFFHFPSFFQSSYYLLYYVLGKYINFKNIKINRLLLVLAILFLLVICYFYPKVGPLTYNSIPVFLLSFVVFIFFYNINTNNKSIYKINRYASSISLDIYLVSSIVDYFVYNYFYQNNWASITQARVILYFPFIILVVYSFSFIVASVRKFSIRIR